METFPRHLSFVMGIYRSSVDSPHTGQWLGALMFSLIFAWTNGWANNRDDLRRHRAHYDVTVMSRIFISIYHTMMGWIPITPVSKWVMSEWVNECVGSFWRTLCLDVRILDHNSSWKRMVHVLVTLSTLLAIRAQSTNGFRNPLAASLTKSR